MPSAREQIFAVIDARLAGVDGVQEYEREPTADPAKFPAIHVQDQGQEPIEEEAGTGRKALTVTVVGYVNGFSGAATHAAMNDLHAEVVKALMTEPPLGLSGVTLIEEEGSLRPDVAALAEQRHHAFAQDFRIEFAHPRGDPTTLA